MVISPPNVIALHKLHVGAYNPRRNIPRDAAWEEFLASLLAHKGVFTPILVRPVIGKATAYEIVAGQRRFLGAMEVFGQDYEIPVLCKEMTDEEALAAATAENIDRENMSPADEATAAAKMLAQCGGNRAETAKRMGWSPANLDNRLKLMACSHAVLTALSMKTPSQGKNVMSIGLAELMSGLPMVKQDELLENFKNTEYPSVETARSMIMSLTKSLPSAIFDKTDCTNCEHNSARQRAMFGNIDEGHCMNAVCFDEKTEAQLQLTAEGLKDDYQRVEIMRPGQNFMLYKLKVENVGEEQATACRSCANFGAAVSAMPNKLGETARGLCFGIACHDEKVAAFKQSQLPPEPETAEEQVILGSYVEVHSEDGVPSGVKGMVIGLPDSGKVLVEISKDQRYEFEKGLLRITEPPADPKAKGAAKAAPKKPAKPAGKADAKGAKPATPAPTIELSNAIHEFRDALYRRVVLVEIAKKPEFNARFVLALLMNDQGSKFSGTAIKEALKKTNLIEGRKVSTGLVNALEQTSTIDNAKVLSMLPNLGTVAIEQLTRDELTGLVKYAKPDLSQYFVLNDESGKILLDKITKSQITAICNEAGISKHMGVAFTTASNGKKDAFIKAITAVDGFTYQGFVPKVLQPTFAK